MEEEKVSNFIVKEILKKKKYFLIQDNNIEKSNFIKILINNKNLSDFNFILLNNNKQELNFKNFNSFFNFSKIDEFSRISFYINNKHILIEHKNFLVNKKNYKITPVLDSNEYKKIFIPKKYNYLDNEFHPDIDKNILIIKNIEDISYNKLKFLNFNLKLIFKNKKFFGGLKVIFIGDLNFKIYNRICIFDLILYNNNKFLNKFKCYTINEKKYLLKYDKFYKNIDKSKTINFNFFFNAYNLDIDFLDKYNFFLHNFIFISNSENIINEINIEENIKLKKSRNIICDDYINKDLFDNINNSTQLYYLNLFKEKLFVAKNLKIIFLKNIDNLKIYKGMIGYIQKIVYKKKTNKKNISVNNIKYIQVKIYNKIFNILPYELILKEKDTIFFKRIQFPFINAWCIHIKFFKYIKLNNIVIVLSENFPYHILEKCFRYSKNLFFKNSFFLTDKLYFKSSMLLEIIEKNFL